MNDLKALVHDSYVEQQGVFVSATKTAQTVWDTLADENPMEAVVSAPNEAAVAKKSVQQIAHLTEHATGVILDLGCGYGRVAQYLLPNKTYSGYIGLDSSEHMLALFKQRYDTSVSEKQTPALFIQSDINAVPLADASVDTVIVSAVFLHNHKSVTRASISEILRVLKPGGQLLVYGSFPNLLSLAGLQGFLYQEYLSLRGQALKNGPVRYYSAGEVRRYLKGFSEVTVYPSEFALLPRKIIFLPHTVDRIYKLYLANPINRLLEKILPAFIRSFFRVHHNVVAKK